MNDIIKSEALDNGDFSMEDPYEVLGVKSDATEKNIRKAFKNLAKIYHPDVFRGPKIFFERIKAAYDLLMDKNLREIYDATGVRPDSDEGNIIKTAQNTLQNLLELIFEEIEEGDIIYVDLISVLTNHIAAKIEECEDNTAKALKKKKKHDKTLEIMTKRLKRKSGSGVNPFTDLIKRKIEGVQAELSGHAQAQAVLKKMNEIVHDFVYEYEEREEPQSLSDFQRQVIMQTGGGWGGSTSTR